MKMKSLAAIVAVAAIAASASAQRPGMGGPGGPGGMRGGMGMGMGRMRDPKEIADRTTQMWTQMLGLSPAQQAKVKAIALKNAIAMNKMREAQMAAIRKVLTPDQIKKMASMRGPGGMGGPGMGRPGMGRPRP